MTRKKDFIWNSSLNDKAIDLIKGMGIDNPDEYKSITNALDSLLKKYTNCDFLEDETKKALSKIKSPWHSNPSDGTIVVDGSLESSDLFLNSPYRSWEKKESLAERKKRLVIASEMKKIRFGSSHSFYIRYSNTMELWAGIPRKVSYMFDCSHNEIVSLKNGPDKARYYDCSYNKLKSLKYVAKEIIEDLDCSNNEITTLIGSKIESELLRFNCSKNKLKNLDGCPAVTRSLNVSHNGLVSMRGAPLNLTLREINLKGNLVSDTSLKMAFNAMKAASGDYGKGLLKIWKKIPMDDQIHMYTYLPEITEADKRKYEAYKNYLSIKDVL